MTPTEIDSCLLDVLTKIDECGWSVVAAEPTPGETGGLPARLAQSLLNQVAERLPGGETIRSGARPERAIGNGLTLTAVDLADRSELGVVAASYGQTARALQLVRPDPEGRRPWQPGDAMIPAAHPLYGNGGDCARHPT